MPFNAQRRRIARPKNKFSSKPGKRTGAAPRRLKGVTRSTASKVLAQGAAGVPGKAFGNTVSRIPRGLPSDCWNATASSHAGLPRAVGPYSVVRTTTMITTISPLVVFGTFATLNNSSNTQSSLRAGMGIGERQWTNVCAMGAHGNIGMADFAKSSIGTNNISEMWTIPPPGASTNGVFAEEDPAGAWEFNQHYSNTTVVPSAISVQIICPESLQTAGGQAVAAVCPVRLDLCGTDKSWKTVGDELLSYFRPRVLTGGKLALRGVQLDSMPLSMTDCSDFRELYGIDPHTAAPTQLCWSNDPKVQGVPPVFPPFTTPQTTFNVPIHPEGWAPLVYYSPYNASRVADARVEMSFLVTTEWRVRFDISNPASSSHVMHPCTTDQQWHNHIQRAQSALPGVLDIVEKVASTGIGVYKAISTAMA